MRFEGECPGGSTAYVNVSDISGAAEIAVIIYSASEKAKAGISKPVVITD